MNTFMMKWLAVMVKLSILRRKMFILRPVSNASANIILKKNQKTNI